MAKGFCPECDQDIDLGKSPREGQYVTCNGCGAYLQVIGLSPIELDWAGDDSFDYDDDVDDDEY